MVEHMLAKDKEHGKAAKEIASGFADLLKSAQTLQKKVKG